MARPTFAVLPAGMLVPAAAATAQPVTSAPSATRADGRGCQVPLRFTGTLDKHTVTLDPPVRSEAGLKLLQEQAQRNDRSSE